MSDERRLASPVATALFRAACVLETRGWRQGTGARDERDPICPHRALREVADIATAAAAYNRMHAYLWRQFGIAGVERWNDAPGRTMAEVVKAMRGAAMERASKGTT